MVKAKQQSFSIESFVTGDEARAPSQQNAIDLIPGWNSRFPDELHLQAGTIPLYSDPRMAWAIDQFGNLEGRQVLELGPLEAGHTSMLATAGAKIDAIEANKLAFLKCLIAREAYGLKNTRFLLGDFVSWLENCDKTYDFIIACGVLYHMREPLRLLSAIANRTNAVYIWTVFVSDSSMKPSLCVPFRGEKIHLYERGYGKHGPEFCGGPVDHPRWMRRDDLMTALRLLGFDQLTVTHETGTLSRERLPTLSVYAVRTSP